MIRNKLERRLASVARPAGTDSPWRRNSPSRWHEITIDPSGGWLYSHSQPSIEGRLRICGRVCPSAHFQHQTKSRCSLDALGAHLELPKRPCRHSGVRGANCNPIRYGIHFIARNRHQDFEFGGVESASKTWKWQFGVALVCNGSPLLHGRSHWDSSCAGI
jgi:hypothetical protein